MALVPLKRCHHPHIDSIPIGPHTRVFEATRGPLPPIELPADRPWPVAPHQHAYDITLFVLRGVVTNVRFETATPDLFGVSLARLRLSTPLRPAAVAAVAPVRERGGFQVEVVRHSERWRFTHEPLPVGQPVRLPAEVFHTIECAQGAAWIVHEGPRRLEDPHALSPRSDIAVYEDLYQPMPAAEYIARRSTLQAEAQALGWRAPARVA